MERASCGATIERELGGLVPVALRLRTRADDAIVIVIRTTQVKIAIMGQLPRFLHPLHPPLYQYKNKRMHTPVLPLHESKVNGKWLHARFEVPRSK